jgi:hypothetical protein
MLNLVIADNLFQLLVGWELVGICSYLLIGHWWEEKENSDAAIKAFITTKTGDVPFLFGIFALTLAAGTSNIPEITAKVAAGGIPVGLLTISALLLFGGAIGKSAQSRSRSGCPTRWPARRRCRPDPRRDHGGGGVYLVARSSASTRPRATRSRSWDDRLDHHADGRADGPGPGRHQASWRTRPCRSSPT